MADLEFNLTSPCTPSQEEINLELLYTRIEQTDVEAVAAQNKQTTKTINKRRLPLRK